MDMTIVNGEIVVKDGKLIFIDEDEIINKGNQIASNMLRRAAEEK